MNLESMFPKGSEDFFNANKPQGKTLLEVFAQEDKKNAPQGRTERKNHFHEALIDPQIQGSKSKPTSRQTLEREVERRYKSTPSVKVRIVGYRTRPLDPDNFAGGCKTLLDGLREAGLIHGDEPWRIAFETSQNYVPHRSQEITIIEIENLD